MGCSSRVIVSVQHSKIWLNLKELSGALGDLGVLLPLATALIAVNGLSATSVFATAGLAYIAAGWYFGVPVPVQPLKALAAIAIVSGLDSEVVASGAVIMGLVLLILSLSGWAEWLASLFTKPLVRGVQLGVGLSLMRLALRMVHDSLNLPAVLSPFLVFLSLVLILFLLAEKKRVPAALVVIGIGVSVSLLSGFSLKGIAWGPAPVSLFTPHANQLVMALFVLVIPQLPLTIGNSIAATASLEEEYFKEKAVRVTPRRLAGSLGWCNLVSGFLMGMPLCHGSGGLTAHYKLGARTRRANFIVGGLCLTMAVLFGRSLPHLLSVVPSIVLASLLFYSGFRHTELARDLQKREEVLTASAMGLVTLLTFNLTAALAAGIACESIRALKHKRAFAAGT